MSSQKTLPELSVQRRVVERVRQLIVEGYSNEVGSEEVVFFYRAHKKSNIVRPNFEDANLKQYIRF